MKSIEISNFKNFQYFKIDNLGLVNLIVGHNNVGKSTLLEAISLLASGANVNWISNILEIRGINICVPYDIEQPELYELENFSTLYHNRDYAKFMLTPIKISSTDFNAKIATANSLEIKLVELIQITETTEDGTVIRRRILKDTLKDEGMVVQGEHGLGLLITCNDSKTIYAFGGRNVRRNYLNERKIPFEYVRTADFTVDKNSTLFDKIALSPLESVLIEALHIIDERINAINFLNDDSKPRLRSNQRETDNRVPFVMLKDSPKKYRLSTMGDGINRILTIILSMINCKDGILLVDEFENGLHYSVQTALWKLISRLAREHNIQVFATTHSQDCIKSFLTATRDQEGISRLIRLEKRNDEIVPIMYEDSDELEYISTNVIETR